MTLPDDLYDYAEVRPLRRRGPRDLDGDRSAVPSIVVTDDWPERIPVTETEVDIFERYFGDVLDTLFWHSQISIKPAICRTLSGEGDWPCPDPPVMSKPLVSKRACPSMSMNKCNVPPGYVG
jgi:hypothetical protein